MNNQMFNVHEEVELNMFFKLLNVKIDELLTMQRNVICAVLYTSVNSIEV